jgi:hypothetical protein
LEALYPFGTRAKWSRGEPNTCPRCETPIDKPNLTHPDPVNEAIEAFLETLSLGA